MAKGFGELLKRQTKLESKRDLLVRLAQDVPWESFRSLLSQVREKPRKSNAGRKPHDAVLMFKLLILQQLYNISDEELEYQVNDRLSFMRFLGLDLSDDVPDATSVWLFRKHLRQAGLIDQLFEQFNEYLCQQGYQAKEGQIVDATLIPVPKQHFRKEDIEELAAGEFPTGWSEHPKRFEQKDLEAQWTQKNGQNHFGYKSHLNIDAKYGFIRRYAVTDASVHDSQMLGELLDAENLDDELWGDSAYRSEALEAVLPLLNFESHIHERAYRNRPLSEEQKEDNRERSRTRARIEHVFGGWTMSLGGKQLRCVSQAAATAHLGLKHLTYNFKRWLFWQTQVAH